MELRTDYKDDILSAESNEMRHYRIIEHSDGTVSFFDVTNYEQVGDEFTADDMNSTNEAVNELMRYVMVIGITSYENAVFHGNFDVFEKESQTNPRLKVRADRIDLLKTEGGYSTAYFSDKRTEIRTNAFKITDPNNNFLFFIDDSGGTVKLSAPAQELALGENLHVISSGKQAIILKAILADTPGIQNVVVTNKRFSAIGTTETERLKEPLKYKDILQGFVADIKNGINRIIGNETVIGYDVETETSVARINNHPQTVRFNISSGRFANGNVEFVSNEQGALFNVNCPMFIEVDGLSENASNIIRKNSVQKVLEALINKTGLTVDDIVD